MREVQLEDALRGGDRVRVRVPSARRGGGRGARALHQVPEVEQQRLAPAERVVRLVRGERLHRTRPDKADEAERAVLALQPRDQTSAAIAGIALQTGWLRICNLLLLQTS